MPLIRSNISARETTDLKEPTFDVLLADFQSPFPELRRNAARGLGKHPEATDTLCSAVAAETQASVREAIFTALIRIGTKPAAAGLVPLLQSEDVGLRNGAIEALKTMPDSVAECIGETLAGTSDVRIFGVDILGALGHPNSARWLMRVIEADRELNVCAAAVDGLAECGDHAAIAPLLRLLERFPDEPFLEFSVRSALERIAASDHGSSSAADTVHG